MKLPDKIDRIAKMELKAPSLKRSKRAKGEPGVPADESSGAETSAASAPKSGGRLSGLKRPVLKRPSRGAKGAAAGAAGGAMAASRAKASGSQRQLPGPLNDLMRDLRDRHLLIPVIVLIAALVAVPVLLSRSPAPTPAAPPAADLASADAIAPAVLVEDVGVRDYKQRLDALKRTNPFESPNLNLDDEMADGSATGDPTSQPGGDPLPDTGTDPGTIPTDPGTTDPGTTDPGTTDPGTQTPDPIIRYIDQVVSYEVDVAAGPELNGLSNHRNLEVFQVLPSEANPVAAYLGVGEGGKRAAFLLAAGADPVNADGCLSVYEPCDVVLLEPGKKLKLDYQPEGQAEPERYGLKVTRIEEVRTRG